MKRGYKFNRRFIGLSLQAILNLLLVGVLAFGGCKKKNQNPCEEKPGYVLCGYCAEEALFSTNPNAGKCIYCPENTVCSSDACDENLECIPRCHLFSMISPGTNLATGVDVSESDDGWGGGANKASIVDGIRKPDTWIHGLAFPGGTRGYADEPCGWYQATLRWPRPVTFNKVMVWHHGIDHVPNVYKIQIWNDDNQAWEDIISVTNGKAYLICPPAGSSPQHWTESFSTPTENKFRTVTTTGLRFMLNNCDITHGWIYEIEVYNE